MKQQKKLPKKNINNIVGKRFVVTGGSAGIGFETARVLTKYGGTVTIASRSEARGELAASKINTQANCMGTAKFEKLDLASFASVKQFLDAQMLHQDLVDVWILNAGMISPKYQRVKTELSPLCK